MLHATASLCESVPRTIPRAKTEAQRAYCLVPDNSSNWRVVTGWSPESHALPGQTPVGTLIPIVSDALLVGLNPFLHKLDGLFRSSNALDLKFLVTLFVVGDKEFLDLIKKV